MGQIMVSSDKLIQVANQLETLNGGYKRSVDRLTETVETLKHLWTGETEQAFQLAFSQDKVKLETFQSVMAAYIQALRQAGEAYAKAEAQNMEIMGSSPHR